MDTNKSESRARFIKRELLSTDVGAGIWTLLFWVLYVLYVFFDIEILHHSDDAARKPIHPRPGFEHPKESFYLWMAIGATVLAVGWAFYRLKRIGALASRGVETLGKVEAIGFVSRGGLSPITISYQVAGVGHQIKLDLLKSDYAVGQSVPLLCDPLAPKNCRVLSSDDAKTSRG